MTYYTEKEEAVTLEYAELAYLKMMERHEKEWQEIQNAGKIDDGSGSPNAIWEDW